MSCPDTNRNRGPFTQRVDGQAGDQDNPVICDGTRRGWASDAQAAQPVFATVEGSRAESADAGVAFSGVYTDLMCPNPETYPVITLAGSTPMTESTLDADARKLYVISEPGGAAVLRVVSTQSNTLVGTYNGSADYPQLPFTSCSCVFDVGSGLVAIMGQAFGWSAFNPANGTFTWSAGGMQNGLTSFAGGHRQLCADPTRGHVLFVAANSGGFGGVEVVSFTSPAAVNVVYNSGYTLPSLEEAPAYSSDIDRYLLAPASGAASGNPSFYYLRPNTWALTASTVLLGTPDGAAGSITHGCWALDGLNMAAVRVAGSNLVFVNLLTDTVLHTHSGGGTVQAAIYDSCSRKIYVQFDITGVWSFDPFAGFASAQVSVGNGWNLHFDPLSNLVYRVTRGTDIDTL